MPELPEVESLVQSLKPVVGKAIRQVFVYEPKTIAGRGAIRRASARKTREFSAGVLGERIIDIARVGKNVLFLLSRGKVLLAHLKMTGQLIYIPSRRQKKELERFYRHVRIRFELSRGELLFNDIRKFGYVLYFPSRGALERTGHFATQGLDPMKETFTLTAFGTALTHKKQSRLKPALLGQGVVAGLGNIYCDEVCFAAGVRPTRIISSLRDKEIERLHASIGAIVKSAIQQGGSSFSTYVRADGSRGRYTREHKVYGRAGEACFVCSAPLTKTRLAGRTTVFCRRCQR